MDVRSEAHDGTIGAGGKEKSRRRSRRFGRFAGACVGGWAMAALATNFTWTGTTNHDYYNSGNWSPSGIPDCCDDTATVVHLSTGPVVTSVDLTDDVVGKGISELTISSSDDEASQAVEFLDGDSSDPVLTCEVFVVDATGLENDLTVSIDGDAMIKTLNSCICVGN